MTKKEIEEKINEAESLLAKAQKLMCEVKNAVMDNSDLKEKFSNVDPELLSMDVLSFMYKYYDKKSVSVRAVNCLIAAGCKTVDDIVRLTPIDILMVRNAGKYTLSAIEGALKNAGLGFSK